MSLVFSSSSATPRTSTYPPFPCLLFLSPFPTLQHALLSAALSTESDLSHGDAEFSSLLTCGHIVTMVSRTVAKATRPPPKRWVPGTPHTERKRSPNKTPANVSTLSLIPPPVELSLTFRFQRRKRKEASCKLLQLSIANSTSMPDLSPRIEPHTSLHPTSSSLQPLFQKTTLCTIESYRLTVICRRESPSAPSPPWTSPPSHPPPPPLP